MTPYRSCSNSCLWIPTIHFYIFGHSLRYSNDLAEADRDVPELVCQDLGRLEERAQGLSEDVGINVGRAEV